MTINDGFRFIYANQSSDEFGVFKGSIGGFNTDSNDESSNLITSKTMFQDRWSLHGIEKSEPLQFKLMIAKQDGTYFTASEERAIKKWLCKKRRHWLYIDQEDLVDVCYYCILINPQKTSVGLMSAGISFDVICDTNHAWSGLRKQRKSSSSGTFRFIFNSDFDEEILSPILSITPSVNGNITIKNKTSNEEISIKNCLSTEVITIDCDNEMIKSSNNRVMLDSWNKKFIHFIEGQNIVEMTGSFVLDMEYRLPIRVGG